MPTQPLQSQPPDYETPPVVETVLGVQFEPLPNFGNAQSGAFWKFLDQREWVSVTDTPTLEPQFEQFEEAFRWQPLFKFQFSQDPRTRLLIKNQADDRMIQVQNNRFHFNWLKTEGAAYPRYETVREGFSGVLKRFVEFLAKEKLGELKANQWEVTYINNIPKATVWNTANDWGFFKPLGAVPTLKGQIEGESFSGEWHFIIPEQRGRLHVKWQHGLTLAKPDEGEETIWLTLTARGPLNSDADQNRAILDGLDLGHVTIVNAFKSFASDQANHFWGLKR